MKISIHLLLLLFLLQTYNATAQEELPNAYHPVSFGVEQDALPYFLKGYMVGGWVGMKKVRVRMSYGQANTPNFWRKKDGIEKERIAASLISVDFFLKEQFRGFWVGPAFGYWQTLLQTDQVANLRFPSLVFSVGMGYNIYLYKGLYISPYLAGHLRITGTKNIELGTLRYTPSLMMPEISLKLGYRF